MTVPFVVYDANGVVLRTGACPRSMLALQMRVDEFVLEGQANDATQYVDIATLTVRDKAPLGGVPNKTTALADGADLVVISNLPNPTTARITGPGVSQTVTVTDGTLELTFAAPGTYTVVLSALHRLDQTVTINAT